MCTLIVLHLPYGSVAGNVVLNSTVEENGRQFACEGEMVTFTCQVVRSLSLQWDSPLISPISFTSDPVNTTSSMSPFTATVTSTAGSGSNRNLTSTLQVTALSSLGRSDTTVVCRNQGRVNQTSRFTVAGNSVRADYKMQEKGAMCYINKPLIFG